MKKLSIGVIISTTRRARFADKPTQWIMNHFDGRADIAAEVVDLRDYPFPFFDEVTSPAYAPPASIVARQWAAKIDQFDGFVFITAEYNHSIPGILKNALDYSSREFNRKPAAFIGYGGVGAARAIEQLRLICIELQLAPIRTAVHISMEQYLAIDKEEKQVGDFDHLNTSAATMISDLVWWGEALTIARHKQTTILGR